MFNFKVELRKSFQITVEECGGFSNERSVLLSGFKVSELGQTDYERVSDIFQSLQDNKRSMGFFGGDIGYKVTVRDRNSLFPWSRVVMNRKSYTRIPIEFDEMMGILKQYNHS